MVLEEGGVDGLGEEEDEGGRGGREPGGRKRERKAFLLHVLCFGDLEEQVAVSFMGSIGDGGKVESQQGNWDTHIIQFFEYGNIYCSYF